jgi:putative transposase
MSHTYTANLLHVVFSTKQRHDLIPSALQPRLWAHMAEIGRNRAIHILAVGGIANHAHALLSLPPVMPLAKAAQALKGISSKWMNEIGRGGFAWQEGYAAFSVSRSQMSSVINYVNSQPEHHRKHSFESKFLSLLTKHGIEYDPKYVFG